MECKSMNDLILVREVNVHEVNTVKGMKGGMSIIWYCVSLI